MRSCAMLLAVFFVATVVLAQGFPMTTGTAPQLTQPVPSHPPGAGIMPARARIQVVPLDMVLARQAEFESLKTRVAQAENDAAKLEPTDPAVRAVLLRQAQLVKALVAFAQKLDSDAGKRPSALEVQRHLNEIEGRVMCEACHTGVVAGSVATQRR